MAASRLRTVGRYAGYTLGAGAATGAAVGTYVYATEPGARRAVRFWVLAGPIVADYSWAKFRGQDQADRTARYMQLHEKHAPNAREIIEELRGMFVKVAQVLSIRAEVVPDAYRREFRKLQNTAPASRWEVVQETLERDLGPISEVFDWIDKEPLGAASIGQAHLVGYKGRKAVVKVQYPDAASSMTADFWCVETLMWLLGEADGVAAVKRVHSQFQVELDYKQEAEHLKGVADAFEACKEAAGFANKVSVPRPIPELTHGSVLGMEYLAGPKLEAVCLERLRALGVSMKGSFDEYLAEQSSQHNEEVRAGLEGETVEDLPESPPSPSSSSATSSAATPATLADAATPTTTATAATTTSTAAADAPPPPTPRLPGAPGGRKTQDLVVNSNSRLLGAVRWVLSFIGLDFSLRVFGWLAETKLWLQRLVTRKSSTDRIFSKSELQEILHLVLEVHGFELFFSPYFNGDPHPGNILMMEGDRIGLIDFGQCVALSEQDKRGVAELLLALTDDKADRKAADARIAKAFFDTGIRTKNSDPDFAAALAKLMFCRLTADVLDRQKMHALFTSDKVDYFPMHVMMAYRTSMLLRGLCLVLQENVSTAHAWAPWAEKWLKAHPAIE
mmetsp:Transcript_26312/g.57092  ORF Transcript_26312/g.57092 Transcript_26312/m.57092 type:complete len:618 (+) Transcript_26312:115-1968(+)